MIEENVKTPPKKTAFNKSLDLLAKQDYSKQKLTQKLLQQGYEVDEVFQAIKKLEEKNLLNEEEYSRRRIISLAQRGKSHALIQIELEREEIVIPEDEIQQILREAGIDAAQKIQEIISKKCRYKNLENLHGDELHKFKQKILRHLLSKGHSLEDSKNHLNQYFLQT